MKDGPITLNRAIKCYTPLYEGNKNFKASKDFFNKYNFHYEDTWSLDIEAAYYLLIRLVFLRDNHYGYPANFYKSEGSDRTGDQKWIEILNKMIRGFYLYITVEEWDRDKHIQKVIDKGFRYFLRYYGNLWD